ncbi:MAG TPA: ribosome maturation factor RimM [Candidatus Binatia bacterium]|nr:ribosome maturation factor RimM [Candidatus Binatia bacterium]
MNAGADESGETPRVLVGIIARAHGLRGEVVVKVMSDAPERFAPGSEMIAAGPESVQARPLRVAASRPFQGRLLVTFEGVERREEAEALHGQELTIERSQVAPLPEGKHYQFELMGLSVRTTAGMPLGRVTDIFSTGSNDVLVVDDDENEILIPMLEGVIVSVDLEGKALVVEPPPGLPGIPEPGAE